VGIHGHSRSKKKLLIIAVQLLIIAVQLLIIAVKKLYIYGNSRSFTDIHVLKKMAVKRKKNLCQFLSIYGNSCSKKARRATPTPIQIIKNVKQEKI